MEFLGSMRLIIINCQCKGLYYSQTSVNVIRSFYGQNLVRPTYNYIKYSQTSINPFITDVSYMIHHRFFIISIVI